MALQKRMNRGETGVLRTSLRPRSDSMFLLRIVTARSWQSKGKSLILKCCLRAPQNAPRGVGMCQLGVGRWVAYEMGCVWVILH